MRKILLFIMTLVFTSCGQDESGDIGGGSSYYVKYDVVYQWKSVGVDRGGTTLHITYTGGNTITTDKVTSYQWTATEGPFKKGDDIRLSVTPGMTYGKVTITGSISVSKDGSLFVTRQSNTGKNISLYYKIE